MGPSIGFLLIALFAGCLATPTPAIDDVERFFYQNEPDSRIVGGTLAAGGSAPYMVALSTGLILKTYICGGSIVSQRHVLTAAHCIQAVYSGNSLTSSLRGNVGDNNWRYGRTTVYSFSRNVTHPHYVHNLIKNDIGLLITSSNIALTASVDIIPLNYNFVDGGVLTRVTGWGNTRFNGASVQNLQELFPTTLNGLQCIREVAAAALALNFNVPHIEPDLELCTLHSFNHGTCNGDSGSPLVHPSGGQIGVVSWGFPCALGVPDMFARISGFQSWLQTNLAVL